MLIVLEPRHRLLHLRASLEREWCQPRRHSMYIGPSLDSKIMSLRRDDIMAIDMEKLQNKETIILPIIWARDASRGVFKGSIIVLWTILNFVLLNSNMIEMKRSVSRWMSLRKKITDMIWRKQRYFWYRKNWWISLNNSGRSGPLRDRSDFNDALTTLYRLHQESGERQTQASAILEVSILAQIIEFFLQLVAMDRSLVELIIIQRKSTNELSCKATW